MTEMVQTVRGPVPASELGRIMPHEHVLCDLRMMGAYLDDPEEAVRDLTVLREAGGSTIIDVTSHNLGREPAKLRAISEESGINIVMGSGWYRESFYDEDLNRVRLAELTERLLADIAEGEDGVRPGIIGEIGADHSWLSGVEERVLRACARAQRQTGLGIVLHAIRSEVGAWQLDVLCDEGVDLRRVAVGHCDTYPHVDYHEQLAKRGAMVMYDLNKATDVILQEKRVRNAVEFIKRGYASHLLLSHDNCTLAHRQRRGGPGYSYVLTDMMPELIANGVPAEVTEQIMIENPLQLLTGVRA